ncbi:MAG TPA: DUF2071 domain-containing protein [Segetibacter sp.]
MRNKKPVFLTAQWQNLAMLNYEVDPQILLPYLPPFTQLDSFNNKTLVSVVGFMFNNTKVFRLKWPLHVNFEEVNLRFYVKHFDGISWKRGVVFISEIVPSPIISFFANSLYHEHYSFTRMRNDLRFKNEDLHVSYEWKHKQKWNKIHVVADASLTPITRGSEEEFIFEHYWGYNKYNNRTTVEYEVEHVTWQIHKVKNWSIDCDVAGLYGQQFVPFLKAGPSSVFLAKGSDVVIRKPTFIKKATG